MVMPISDDFAPAPIRTVAVGQLNTVQATPAQIFRPRPGSRRPRNIHRSQPPRLHLPRGPAPGPRRTHQQRGPAPRPALRRPKQGPLLLLPLPEDMLVRPPPRRAPTPSPGRRHPPGSRSGNLRSRSPMSAGQAGPRPGQNCPRVQAHRQRPDQRRRRQGRILPSQRRPRLRHARVRPLPHRRNTPPSPERQRRQARFLGTSPLTQPPFSNTPADFNIP